VGVYIERRAIGSPVADRRRVRGWPPADPPARPRPCLPGRHAV